MSTLLFKTGKDGANEGSGRLGAKRTAKLSRLKARRKLWLKVHLYLGLALGPIFVIVGLTGSIIAFGGEIDRWLNSELFALTQAEKHQPILSVDDLLTAARAGIPAESTALYIAMPRRADDVFTMLYSTPGNSGHEADTQEMFMNPYTAHIIGHRVVSRADTPFGGPLIPMVVQLHYNLLFGPPGALFVGIVSVILIESVLTGIIVWWPLTGKWWHVLRFNRSGNKVRTNFEVHRFFGFYSAVILIMLLFSGIYMNLPESVTRLVEIFSPAPGWPENVQSTPAAPAANPITAGKAVSIADQRFPDGELIGIQLPKNDVDTFVVRKRAPNEVTQAYTHRQLWIDQYSGAIRALTDPNAYTAGQKFLEWQYPLHSGEAFGLFGRIIICVSGLVPALLYITGFLRWRQKRARGKIRKT